VAFANIAGRAGFVIDLDKSAIDRGLPQVEQQFTRSMGKVEATTRQSSLNASRNLDPLLAKVREMRVRADELSGRARALGTGLDTTSRSASTLDAGMGSLIARGAGFSLALTAAYQASRQLQDSLEQTGEEAYTTEGRVRNFGASLLSGDIVGGIKALGALPSTMKEAGLSADEAFAKYDMFKKLVGADGPIGQLAREVVGLVDNTRSAEAAANSLADAYARVGTNIRVSTGEAVAFKGAHDSIRPGEVDQINTNLAAQGPTSGRIARPIGPTARNAAAQTLAQARGDLPELLRLQQEESARREKAVANSRGNDSSEANNAATQATPGPIAESSSLSGAIVSGNSATTMT